MTLPVLALIGRPNVGKSTLFNRITRSRDALVDDQPGVTRDRLYGLGHYQKRQFLVVDTGGLESEVTTFSAAIAEQVDTVVQEADYILFLVDHEDGLVAQDYEIAKRLRRADANVMLLVNKTEGLDDEIASAEFQELALGMPYAISAKRGDGVRDLLDLIFEQIPRSEQNESDDTGMTVTLAGRPNVGKSTLTNKLVGEYRVIVSDQPGTTRDSVRVPLQVGDEKMTLIDTAGVRKKSRIDDVVEKFSVVKTFQAIEQANVVVLVLDASREIGAQDSHIAGMIQELGRSMVIVVNKWDRLTKEQRDKIKDDLSLKLPFIPEPEILFISALHGSNITRVMPAVRRAMRAAMCDIPTSSLNRTLKDAVTLTSPPMHQQRPVRLKFAHQAGKNPPIIVVHGTQAETIPVSYKKYLENFFRHAYKLVGTPIRIIPRTTSNPYAESPKKATKKTTKLKRDNVKTKRHMNKRGKS